MCRISTLIAIATLLSATSAAAGTKTTPEDALFCPSWAEAHEHSLASLNGGRAPYKVSWKGCVRLKKGTQVDLVSVDNSDGANEIIYKGQALVHRRRPVLIAALSRTRCGTFVMRR